MFEGQLESWKRQPTQNCCGHKSTVELENLGFAMCMRSEDAIEGTRAFLEKREPKFRGR